LGANLNWQNVKNANYEYCQLSQENQNIFQMHAYTTAHLLPSTDAKRSKAEDDTAEIEIQGHRSGLTSPNFSFFFGKTLKIHILDSQQKIVAFQSK